MRNYNDNPTVKMTFEFALEIIEFSEKLREQKKFVIGEQVVRSGCSTGTAVRKTRPVVDESTFIQKLKIGVMEVEETEYWLIDN